MSGAACGYDVLVAGAGPAGCTAAKILADSGLRVLLAEKCRLPRNKPCSGILIRKTLDLAGQYFGALPPPEVRCAPEENRGMVFTDDAGQEFRFEQPGMNIWRSAFDSWLAGRAVRAGAVLRDGTAVNGFTDNGGSITAALRGAAEDTVTARYIIICEGAAGTLRRGLLRRMPEPVITYQTFSSGSIGLDPHYFYAYLQPAFSEYDAWCNIKDGQIVTGVAVRDAAKRRACYGRFTAFLRDRFQLRVEKQLREEKWMMPRIRPGCTLEYGRGRILLAGEAAGLLNPMGEGISAAMESGFHAACAVAVCLDEPAQVLAAYRQAAEPLRAYMQRQWRLAASLAPPLLK